MITSVNARFSSRTRSVRRAVPSAPSPGRRLVEEQDARRCRQRETDFQRSSLAVGEIARAYALASAQTHALENRRRLVLRGSVARAIAPGVERALAHCRQRDEQIVECRIVVEQADGLERPGDTEAGNLRSTQATDGAPVQTDLAAVRRVHAGQAVEARGLAGAVRAHDSGERTRFEREVDLLPAPRGRQTACAAPMASNSAMSANALADRHAGSEVAPAAGETLGLPEHDGHEQQPIPE